jgi:hypothetical protein
VGSGRLWVSRYPGLFGNAALGEADNARLLANVLGSALGPDGVVLFDDMHQGLSDLYDPQAFFADPRLHNTLLFIFGFWMLYVIGYSNRLGPPAPSQPAVSRQADLVRAVGGLFARRLRPHTVAERLYVHFFDEIRGRRGLPTNGQPVWQMLRLSPRLDRERLEQLMRMYERTRSGHAPDLMMLSEQLRLARKDLQ